MKQINKITHSAILAATLTAFMYFNNIFTPYESIADKMLGALKEMQFYIIPVFALYMAKKVGNKEGLVVSISGAAIGTILCAVLGLFYKLHPATIIFAFLVPWVIPCFIILMPRDNNVKLWLSISVIWILVIASWAVEGIIVWKYTLAGTLFWSLVTYHGWAMFIVMPLIVILLNKKINN